MFFSSLCSSTRFHQPTENPRFPRFSRNYTFLLLPSLSMHFGLELEEFHFHRWSIWDSARRFKNGGNLSFSAAFCPLGDLTWRSVNFRRKSKDFSPSFGCGDVDRIMRKLRFEFRNFCLADEISGVLRSWLFLQETVRISKFSGKKLLRNLLESL